jgi:hypothetical protein
LEVCQAKIQNLQNQVNSLQDRISDLETKLRFEENSKYALSRTRMDEKTPFTSQQGNSTMKSEKSLQKASLFSNDKKVNSESLSEDNIRPLEPLSESHQDNPFSNEDIGLHQPNFITLGKITEPEKIEIIKRGFQLQNEGKIALKKYYETTQEYSLFQFKGYNIKYESIRRKKLYQQLKF